MNKTITYIKHIITIAFIMISLGEAHAIKTVNGKKCFSYMVQTGESLDKLASAFKVTVDELIELNEQLKNGLKENEIIQVPIKESLMNANLPDVTIITYKVKPGDTLFSLAKNNNTTIEDIIQRNMKELGDGMLMAGSVIKIAQNSGGLTGGEDKKGQNIKIEDAIKEFTEKKTSATDSLEHAYQSYWTEAWSIIDVVTPGTINTLRNEREWQSFTRIKVIGTVNGLDVAVIGKRIFEFDRIIALDMHEVKGMTKISTKDFEECQSLKALSLPNSIDSIGAESFRGCGNNLEVLRCYALTPPACVEKSFSSIDLDKCMLEVPKDAVEKYKASEEWKKFKNIKSIPTIADEKK